VGVDYSTLTAPPTRAPRSFVETMGYMPIRANRRLNERIEASELIAKAMNQHRCKKCRHYEVGCIPGQIILCTKSFLVDVENGMAEAYRCGSKARAEV